MSNKISKRRNNTNLPVLLIDKKTGRWFVYMNLEQAAEELGLNKGHASQVIKGERKTEHGYYISRLNLSEGPTFNEETLRSIAANKIDVNDILNAFTEYFNKASEYVYIPGTAIVESGTSHGFSISSIDIQLKKLEQLEAAANKILAAQIRECREICERELKKLYELEDIQRLSVDQLLRKERYLELRNQIDNELKKLGEEVIDTVGTTITDAAKLVMPNFNVEQLKAFTQIDYGGIQFSERIWHNLTELREQLYDTIKHSVVLGYSYKDAARELAERFNVSENRARCLTRTETARAYNRATEQNYRDNGITEVEVYVERGACEDCEKLRNKKFKLGELELPLHPNCRCALLPVVKKKGE